MPRTPRKGPTPRKQASEKAAAIYHVMRADEDFEMTAEILFKLVQDAAEKFPGKPRHLYLDIDGHRNSEGGYDHDAFELITNFMLGFLGPYLTKMTHPLSSAINNAAQREDLPPGLFITPGGDESDREERMASMAARGIEVFDADTMTIVPAQGGGDSALD